MAPLSIWHTGLLVSLFFLYVMYVTTCTSMMESCLAVFFDTFDMQTMMVYKQMVMIVSRMIMMMQAKMLVIEPEKMLLTSMR